MKSEPNDFIEKIHRFRDDRLREINSRKTPVPLFEGAKMVMHIIPVSAFNSYHTINVQLTQIEQETLFQKTWFLSASRANSHRYLFYHPDRPDGEEKEEQKKYIQLFRSGVLEFVMTCSHEEGVEKLELPARLYGGSAIQFLRDGMRFLAEKNIVPPYIVFLTFLRIHGCKLALSSHVQVKRESAVYDRDSLFLPEVLVRSENDDPEQVIRPLLDMLWYTFYEEACLDYGKDGRWVKGIRHSL